MEASQALHRCISQVLAKPTGCMDVLRTSGRLSSRRQQCIKFTPASARTFVASASRSREPQPPASSSLQNTDTIVPDSAPQMPEHQRPRGQASRSSYAKDERRIDLSTLPGIGSNYSPPKRDPVSAKAKLESLLQRSSAPHIPSRTEQAPQSLADAYAFERPRNDSNNRFTASAAQSADLLEFIDSRTPLKTLADAAKSAPIPLRLRPTLGRTQAVRPEAGLDLTRAFRTLEMKCNANNVKRDEIAQRFHVRRGQKKKLDRSKRWRIMFKEGFLEECSRVRRMMRQGW